MAINIRPEIYKQNLFFTRLWIKFQDITVERIKIMKLPAWLFDLIFGKRIDPKAEAEKELTAKYGEKWWKYDGVIH